MEIDLKKQQYVDWKVFNVMAIDNAYGYRIKLFYADGSDSVQQKGGFTSKKEAEQARTETIGQLYSNTYVVYENLNLGNFLEFWLEKVIRPQKAHETYVGYKNAVVNHILPQLGKKKLSKINRGDVQSLYNKEVKKSESVARQVKIVMGTSMDYALDKKMISFNPAKGVNLPKDKKEKKNAFRVRHIDEQKTLTYEQVLILLEAAKSTTIYLQVMFAVLMGLRRSEIVAVKYTDIDYVNRTLHVERQLGVVPMSKKEDFEEDGYTRQEIGLKTESSNRIIPIPDILFEEIIEERERYEKNKRRRINDKNHPFLDEKYICCSTYGKPRSRDYHWSRFKKLLKENDLPNIRWHDLRATYCTLLLKNNFSPKAVSKLMGHAKEIITIDVYADKRMIIGDCLDVLEPFIEEILPIKDGFNLSEIDLMDDVILDLLEERQPEKI